MPEDQNDYEKYMDTDLETLKALAADNNSTARELRQELDTARKIGFAMREAIFRRETGIEEGCTVKSVRRPYEGQVMKVTAIVRSRPIVVRGYLFKKDGTVGKKVAVMRFFEKCDAPKIVEETE